MNNLEIRLAAELFLFDTDSDDENDFNKLEKVKCYFEETVPKYNFQQFKQHFRLTPTTYEILMGKLHSVVDRTEMRISGNPELTLEKQMLIALWYLANIESFRCAS